jgi:hypothetical protein
MTKTNKEGLHMLMRQKYDEVTRTIMSWEGIPAFWTMTLFTCTDLKGDKPREDDESLWRAYKRNKADITNVLNLAVSRAAAQMQSKKVPSGKGMEFWFHEILYQCWQAELNKEPDPVDTSLGGSASKAAAFEDGEDDENAAASEEGDDDENAAASEEGDDAETRDASEMTGDGDGEKLEGDAVDEADDKTNKRKAASRSSRAATENKKGKAATEVAGERKAPEGYFPKHLPSMVYLGVLSKQPHPQLGWPAAVEQDGEGDKDKAPSREALRAAATTASAKRESLGGVGGSKSGGGGGRKSVDGSGYGGKHEIQVKSFIDGQRWGNELTAWNSKSAALNQLVKMAKEDLDDIKDDDDFDSNEERVEAIKKAKAALSGHRNALREHLRTPQPTDKGADLTPPS